MESSHDSKLKDPHYGNVKEGKKIYEVRVYDETRQKMKVSDIWIFSHNDNKDMIPIKTRIVEIKIYRTFREAIEDTDLDVLLPGIDDVNKAIETYNKFPHKEGTYKIGAKKYGVVRFKLELIY